MASCTDESMHVHTYWVRLIVLYIVKKTWRLVNLCGKIGLGKAQKIGEGIKQWTDFMIIAVHWVVSV